MSNYKMCCNCLDSVLTLDYKFVEDTIMWLPIETAPLKSKKIFVVKAFKQKTSTGQFFNSDPYCVWRNDDDDGSFARWPHDFKPTHWLPLPED